MATEEQPRLSFAICGQDHSGKLTASGHLLFELGGVSEEEVRRCRADALRVTGSDRLAFAWAGVTQPDRGCYIGERIIISVPPKEFFTEKRAYTLTDVNRDFTKKMITGAVRVDLALLMVPADEKFLSAIVRGNHMTGVAAGQTRQYARLLNLLGVKQLVVGVNKMDCDVAQYQEERFNEIKEAMQSMLVKTGWKKDFVEKSVPVLPISGRMGDNLLKKSEMMAWWKGQDVLVEQDNSTLHVETLLDVLNDMARLPDRKLDAPMRMVVTGVSKIRELARGHRLTGRVEQGVVKPHEVLFLPTHTAANACTGKVSRCETHGAEVGATIDLDMKGLPTENMPCVGDVMVYAKDPLMATESFHACVCMLEISGELTAGFSAVCFLLTGGVRVRMTQIVWKIGKETGGKRVVNPPSLKANEMAEVVFALERAVVVDTHCKHLSRIALWEGDDVVMIGKVVPTTVQAERA